MAFNFGSKKSGGPTLVIGVLGGMALLAFLWWFASLMGTDPLYRENARLMEGLRKETPEVQAEVLERVNEAIPAFVSAAKGEAGPLSTLGRMWDNFWRKDAPKKDDGA